MKGIAEELLQDRIKYLRENTDFVATLFESLIGYAIIAADFDGNVIAYNDGARQIYGYAPEEIIGKQNIEIFFPREFIEAGKLQQIIDELIGKGRFSYEGEKVRKSGERFLAHILFTLTKDKDGKVVGFIEMVEDLTECKRVEKGMRASEEQYRMLVENANEAIVVAQDGMLKFVNPKATEVTGYSKEELTSVPFMELIYPDDREIVLERQGRGLKGEEISYVDPFRMVGKGGNIKWVEINAVLITWMGRPATLNFLSDITERKRVEEALRQSEANLRNVINNNADGVIVLDRRATLLFLNPAAQALLGEKAEELVGEMFGFPTAAGETTELDINRANGEAAVAEVRFAETEWKGESAYLATLRDITERKRAKKKLQQAYEELERAHRELRESQARLIQSEKMSAVGTLAAGLAHELNNPLMGMLNFSQYCLKHTSEDDRRYSVLRDIEHETMRCIAIVRNLLTFSHMEKENEESYQKVSCATVLDQVLKLLSYRIERQRVLVTQHTDEGTPDVPMVTNKMQQVFLNILSNALDALREREKREIHIDVCREGGFVQVAIADSGCGIPPEKLTKVFDPFFTTNPAGQGTGLGLTVVRSIVQAHGGEITCQSEPGAGTTFNVLLPMKNEKEITT
jgi:PAS domain S-box-containing protein